MNHAGNVLKSALVTVIAAACAMTMGLGSASATSFGASTGSTSGQYYTASVNGNINQVTAKAQALDALHKVRQDAYDTNVPIGSTHIQDWVKTQGLTESQYVNIPWSSNMEKIAMQRAVESGVCAEHTRPDGTSTFSTSAGGKTSYGEILAWGYSSMANAISVGWAGEKSDYLKYMSGQSGYGQYGHYSIMIGTGYKSFGMSGFQYTTRDYGTQSSWSGEFALDAKDSTTGTNVNANVNADFTITSNRTTVSSVSTSANTVKTGETITASATAACNSANSISNWNAESFKITAAATGGSWVSENANVASVNASNGVITGESVGSTRIGLRNAATGSVVYGPSITVTQGAITNVSERYSGYTAGTYYIVPKWNTGSSMDIAGGSKNNGAAVQEYAANRSGAQRFAFTKNANGSWKIESVGTGKVLDVPGANRSNGVRLQQYDDNGSAAQQWDIKDNGDGSISLISRIGTSVSVDGGSSTNGARFQMWKFNGDKSQRFYLIPETTPVTGKTVSISASGNTRYGFNVPGNTVNNTDIQLYHDDGTSAGRFVLNAQYNGFFEIRNTHSNKCLEIPGASGNNGVRLRQYQCNDTPAQRWFAVTLGNNVYSLYNASSGKSVDLSGNSLVNGGSIQQYSPNHSAAQQWRIA